MSYTVGELEDAINEADNDFWDDMYSQWRTENGLDTAFGVAYYEADGAEYNEGRQDKWVVFRVGDRYFRQTGYYDSWAGGEWDGTLEEVRPRQKMITVYDNINPCADVHLSR